MPRLSSSFAALCLAAALPLGLHAAEPPAALKSLQQQGLVIVGPLPSAPGGLKAWGAYAGTQPLAVYETPDGRHVMLGTLVDAEGREVQAPGLDELVQPALGRDMLSQLERTTWIADGKDDAPRKVYVFSDPNCPYCMAFWQAARPWVDEGKVQLRHVLVGILAPSSGAKAAALMGAPDPAAALREHSLAMLKDRKGGVKPLAEVPAGLDEKIRANEDLMVGWDLRATPAMVWMDEHGRLQTQTGAAPDALERVLGAR